MTHGYMLEAIGYRDKSAQVVPIDPVTPHSDLNIASGPCGTLLVNSPKWSLKLLQSLQATSEQDQRMLDRLIRGTEAMQESLLPLVAKQTATLAESLPVIPFPATF
jgi:hypothetical protein